MIYADIPVGNGGLLHIIGGFLHPIADKDVVPLVQECGKYDGFVTLASGTGFSQELAGSPDGYTLFLPSNDALSKVPKDELEVIRTNTTALKGEFTSRLPGYGTTQSPLNQDRCA